uniref:Plastocyanin-like domain-containing protein n=1 Tax=Nymphaea colorata TaxID=210225 RepID=A0A5K0YQJ8_9MAGN|nr:unnamed protein product [Nymphaea colorata]
MPPLLAKNNTNFVKSFNDRLRSQKPHLCSVTPHHSSSHRPRPALHSRVGQGPLPVVCKRDQVQWINKQHHVLAAHGGATSGALLQDGGSIQDGFPRPADFRVQFHRRALGGQPWHQGGHQIELDLPQFHRPVGATDESHPFHSMATITCRRKWSRQLQSKQSPCQLQLVCPPESNTIAIPMAGWTAVGFRANNPGNQSSNTTTHHESC